MGLVTNEDLSRMWYATQDQQQRLNSPPPKPAEREAVIPSLLRIQEQMVSRLLGAITMLEQRLRPVSRTEPRDPWANATAPATLTPDSVMAQIDLHNAGIEVAGNRLEELLRL